MNDFVYLYRGGNSTGTPEQMQKQMERWGTWLKELGAKGHLKDMGHPLEAGGTIVKGKAKGAVTDGPFAEAKDLIGGYSLVQATDLAQAAELSKGCPIFEVGGVVEVRPIMKMNM
ncbi:MAG TPA: YciI family protein [Polyangiaceae bacterium]|nr:YciI family protein [Polyangiaceae bacterium]